MEKKQNAMAIFAMKVANTIRKLNGPYGIVGCVAHRKVLGDCGYGGHLEFDEVGVCEFRCAKKHGASGHRSFEEQRKDAEYTR